MPCGGEAPISVYQISSLQGGDNGLFVEGFLNELACRMIVDTGANVTIIRTDVARRLNVQLLYTAPSVSLQTVSGDKIGVHGKIKIPISFGFTIYPHTVYVADITDPCILGLDFLKKYNFCLDLERKELRTSREEVPLFGLESVELYTSRILALEDITIPARTECIAFGAADVKDNIRFGVTDFPLQSSVPKGVLVGASLVDLSQNVVPVRVANISDGARVIRKGDEIATCTPVISIEKESGEMSSEPLENLVEDLIGGATLNPKQKLAVTGLIKDFRDVFSTSSKDVGRTKVTQHRIDTGSHLPIKQHPRRLPYAKQEEVGNLLREMQENNVIEPSSSPWASPIVLVKKKDGSTRFCVDYRKLNDVTKKDSYPLPRIDDTLDTLSGNKWFSTLDLKSGYWQVEIHPDDREKTAFTTGQGLWQFQVMPFGLCNAPATFERLMETVLREISYEACLIYLDDIIVFGRDFDQHLRNIRRVLLKLREAKLKLSPSKCNLFRREVSYLGHIISSEGVRTDPQKIHSVQNWSRPQDVHELRSFLGLCTYYRKFVKGFSKIARPLHRLTESKQKFLWTTECDNSFLQLKNALTSAPILAYPEPGKDFILDTDASNEGVGAVLSQEIDGQERVIAYFSKSLSRSERNYCVTRKELLAIVKAVEHFHHYLYGRKFLLRTDHASLTWLLNFKNPEGQVARWIQRLQEYDFEIRHRKGISHGNADALSRRPCPEACRHCIKAEEKFGPSSFAVRQIITIPPDPWSDESIRKSQLEDPDLKPVIEFMEAANGKTSWQDVAALSPTTKRFMWDSLHLKNGVLHRRWESDDGKSSRWQLVLPRSRVKSVLEELHSSSTGGHFGIMKTLHKIRERFFWDKSKSDVEKWCRSCSECSARKGPKIRSRGRLQRYNVGAPFERIALDILGPLPRTTDGNKYILVVMDYFTKWPEAYSIPDQEATTVAEILLQNWISRFGVPLLIHSDQGTNFNSAVFTKFCELLGMEKTRTTPLHPQSDGMVERFNRTILNHLSIFVSRNQQDWDKKLPLFLLAYRSAVHETTGYTPFHMLFGKDLRLPCDLLFGRSPDTPTSPVHYVEDLQARLEDVHRFARERVNIMTERMKKRYDVKSTDRKFKEGDKVWLWNPKRRKGLSPKLQSCWEGPYTIVKLLNDVVVRIQRTPSAKPKVVHYDRLAWPPIMVQLTSTLFLGIALPGTCSL